MITEIRNGNNVKRFHTTSRTQEETVGHHSANVCGIMLRINPDCSRDLLVAALYHDVAEYYTGDVPSPFKWDNPDVKVGLDGGEEAYLKAHNIPQPQYLTVEDIQLLKLADMMDLILSSLEEAGRGNQSALDLVENGGKYITGMGLDYDTLLLCDEMVREVKLQWRLTTNK